MGVLVVNHYTSKELISFIGAQLPSPNVTEVSLYSAYLEDGLVHKDEVLASVKMSDLQFGQMIGRPNFSDGQICTTEFIKEHDIFDAIGNDGYKTDLSKRVNELLESENDNILRFFDTMLEIVNKFSETSRLSKSAKVELEKYLNLASQYVEGNEAYALNQINEVASKRVNEIKSTIHQTIRDAHRIGGESALKLEDLSNEKKGQRISNVGYLNVLVNGHSGGLLFDEINSSSSVVSVEMKAAKLAEGDVCSIREMRLSDKKNIFRIKMSPEQYAQFVRADSMEVSCTIDRFCDHYCGSVDEAHTDDVQPLKIKAGGTLEAYQSFMSDMLDAVEKGQYKGKKGASVLLDEINKAKSLYADYVEHSKPEKEKAIADIADKHQRDVERFGNEYIKKIGDYGRSELVASAFSELLSLHAGIEKK